MRARWFPVYVVITCGMLAACGSVSAPTRDIHDLRSAPSALPVPPPTTKGRAPSGLLVVALPSALPPLDSERLVVRTNQGTLSVLPGVEWQDRLPLLFQARLVEAFETAKLMRSVVRSGDGLTGDRRLLLTIRQFEIDEATGEAVVDMAVRLVDERTGTISAGTIINARHPADAQNQAAAADALGVASAQVIQDIIHWTQGHVSRPAS